MSSYHLQQAPAASDVEEQQLQAELEQLQAELRKQELRIAIARKKRALEDGEARLEFYKGFRGDNSLGSRHCSITPDITQTSESQELTHDSPISHMVLNDTMICPREETVSALWKRIQRYHVVHVRATPGSGKSILSRLLQDYVRRKSPNMPVY